MESKDQMHNTRNVNLSHEKRSREMVPTMDDNNEEGIYQIQQIAPETHIPEDIMKLIKEYVEKNIAPLSEKHRKKVAKKIDCMTDIIAIDGILINLRLLFSYGIPYQAKIDQAQNEVNIAKSPEEKQKAEKKLSDIKAEYERNLSDAQRESSKAVYKLISESHDESETSGTKSQEITDDMEALQDMKIKIQIPKTLIEYESGTSGTKSQEITDDIELLKAMKIKRNRLEDDFKDAKQIIEDMQPEYEQAEELLGDEKRRDYNISNDIIVYLYDYYLRKLEKQDMDRIRLYDLEDTNKTIKDLQPEYEQAKERIASKDDHSANKKYNIIISVFLHYVGKKWLYQTIFDLYEEILPDLEHLQQCTNRSEKWKFIKEKYGSCAKLQQRIDQVSKKIYNLGSTCQYNKIQNLASECKW